MPSEFTWTPHYDTQLIEEPRVLSAKLGDGYEQRSLDGLNAIPQKWTVPFKSIKHVDAAAIVVFLQGKAGVTSFTWTPPEYPEIKVICRKWPRTIKGPNLSSMTLIFEQAFDL
jgi:Enterobacteria phage tail tip protein M